jgi:hypothetical protein
MLKSIFLATTFLFSGCVGHFAMASKLNDIKVGMTKSQVLTFMGSPDRTASGNSYEDLTYTLNESAWDTKMPEPYVIHMVNGKVDRFGTDKEMEQFESKRYEHN